VRYPGGIAPQKAVPFFIPRPFRPPDEGPPHDRPEQGLYTSIVTLDNALQLAKQSRKGAAAQPPVDV
jgi:hypothetical protein